MALDLFSMKCSMENHLFIPIICKNSIKVLLIHQFLSLIKELFLSNVKIYLPICSKKTPKNDTLLRLLNKTKTSVILTGKNFIKNYINLPNCVLMENNPMKYKSLQKKTFQLSKRILITTNIIKTNIE